MSGVGSCEEDTITGLNGFSMDLFHCFWNIARSDIIEGGRRLLKYGEIRIGFRRIFYCSYSKRWLSMLPLVLASLLQLF